MFSGKSSHAMSYIRRQRAIGKRVVVIKPDIDMRYSNQSVMVTHNGEQLPCTLWNTDIPLTPTTDIENAEGIIQFRQVCFICAQKEHFIGWSGR